MKKASEKIYSEHDFVKLCNHYRSKGLKVVFTNGCFDLFHLGHLRYLEAAREAGDILVVAVNSDRSVRSIKGASRPIISERARAEVVAGLHCVDAVTIFDEDTPLILITKIKPFVIVKGADWAPEHIVGKDIVESYGGRVTTAALLTGYSTTSIIAKIKSIP